MHYSPQCGAQGKSFVGSRACLTSPGHGSADFRIACPTNIFGELGRRAAPRPAKLGRLGPDGGGSSWPICRNQRCYKTRVARKKPNRYSNRGRCRPRVGLINDNGHHSPNAGRLLGKVVDKLLEILGRRADLFFTASASPQQLYERNERLTGSDRVLRCTGCQQCCFDSN